MGYTKKLFSPTKTVLSKRVGVKKFPRGLKSRTNYFLRIEFIHKPKAYGK